MTFIETFSATSLTLLCAWIFKKYLEPLLDKGHERIKRLGGNKMGKLMLDIEHASNGSYIVTWYKNNPSALQKLAGTHNEKEQLAFTNAKELVDWINKTC